MGQPKSTSVTRDEENSLNKKSIILPLQYTEAKLTGLSKIELIIFLCVLNHLIVNVGSQFYMRLKRDFHLYLKGFFITIFFMSLLLFLSCFSGPPTPSCQKMQENHKIGPQMSRIGTRKVKETQKIVFQIVSISGNTAEKFSDSLCSSEKYFRLYFQTTRPEIYYV